MPLKKLKRKPRPPRGLGDAVAKVTAAVGIKPCGGCTERQGRLNRWLPSEFGKTPEGRTTIGVTAYLRPEALSRCIDSLEKHYPQAKRIVEDTGGNLSAGRNRIVGKADTEFVWILEDDFELIDDSSLAAMVDVLDSDAEIGVVCGRLFQVSHGGWGDYANDIRRFRGTLQCTPPNSSWLATPAGTLYSMIDMGWNFFLARREVLQDCPWDEDLPLREHAAWFWQLKQQSQWRVAFTRAASAKHHQDRPSPEYRKARSQTRHMEPVLQDRYGFVKVTGHQLVKPSVPVRPNIVVLGVGHSNTSITTRQLFALGWNAGDADAEFSESVSVRDINLQIAKTGEFSLREAREALAALPKPWAVNDPRFCKTLGLWLPAMVPYEPLLLWVRKDLAVVRDSYRRRGQNWQSVDRRFAQAREHFENWPWAKLAIDAEHIAEAVTMFDRSYVPSVDL